ncbi:hypothetical protein F4604DRAFT_1681325 [Suillus subluteus]|nr:hypothetical protein F4604DRAFT_1681325 [Suillus subluteus]
MSQPAEHQVQFNLPMDTDDESSYAGISQSPTSNANVTPKAFYFGIGLPPGPQPKFNFGMDIQDHPAGPLPTASVPPTATQPFNFGFDLHIPAAQPATPPALIQELFNFGLNLAVPIPAAQPATPAPIQEPFNFSLNLAIPTQPTPATPNTTPQPFNLGFNIPIKPKPTASTPPAKAPPATVSTSQHHSNLAVKLSRRLDNGHRCQFQRRHPFQCQCRCQYQFPFLWHRQQCQSPGLLPTKQFDKLAQMMASSIIQDASDIREPTPDEMLGINQVMLSSFSESRDRLTRIFKDLISLHHIAQVHDGVAPAVAASMKEVERAEANAAKQ